MCSSRTRLTTCNNTGAYVSIDLNRGAQGQHAVAVKLTCSAGETNRLKIKGRLVDQRGNQETKRNKGDINERKWGEGMGATQNNPRFNLLQAFPRVNHGGLINLPTNRNSDWYNVRTQY